MACIASPNYALSKPTHRQSIGHDNYNYPPTSPYQSASPRTSHRTAPHLPPSPWPSEDTTATAAAQKAVSELFPELNGSGIDVDIPCDAFTTTTDYYTTPTSPYYTRRESNVLSPSAINTAHKTAVQEDAYFPNPTHAELFTGILESVVSSSVTYESLSKSS